MKKSTILKDNIKRNLFKKYYIERCLLKYLAYNNLSYDKKQQLEAFTKLAKLTPKSSITQIRNRCIISGRPRSVLKLFKLGRNKLKEFYEQGLLVGIKKSSW